LRPILPLIVLSISPLLAAAGADSPDGPVVLDSGLAPEDVEQRPYLDYVRACVDRLIERGTDRYGRVHSPLLMNILDVRTGDCPADPLPLDEAYRVTRRGRRGPGGGNLYPDQAALAAMVELTELTGRARYAEFATRCANYTMTELVDERGFFWWGWHRHYDAFRDEMTGHSGNPHEIHVQTAQWPLLWNANREAVQREIEAIWQWHVIDKTTGEVNRHGDGERGCDFAMSGGEILAAFAFLYQQTKEPQWLQRARLVADYYWDRRHPETNLIANRPNAGADRFDGSHFDTSITALHCRGLLDAYRWTGDAIFRDRAVAYLQAYARYGYDAEHEQFWGCLRLDGTPEPGPRVVGDYAQYEPRGAIDLWQPYAAGYEFPVRTARVYAEAYKIKRDPVLMETAKRWADLLERGLPAVRCQTETWYGPYARQWAPLGTYAGNYADAIAFFVRIHELTGEQRYGNLARQVAREAVSRLYYDGWLRGHPGKPYYESIDGVGELLLALLELHRMFPNRR